MFVFHISTIKLVHALGEDFDLVVNQWREVAEEQFSLLQVGKLVIPFIFLPCLVALCMLDGYAKYSK